MMDYDPLDRRTKVTDPLGNVTNFAYDTNSNLLSVTDAKSGVHTYSYDARDRRVAYTDPLSATQSFGLDGLSNVTQWTARNGVIATYTYDGLNRRTQSAFGQTLIGSGPSLTPPDATVGYTFDGTNRLTQIVDTQGGTITRSYDNLDHLLSETTSLGTVSYTYDAADRRTSMTVTGQTSVNYSYDVGSRLTNLSNGSQSAAFTYDADNRRATLTLPNGVTVSYGYDNAGQLINLSYAKGGTSLGNLSYGYDNVGQRVQLGGSLARTTLPGAVSSTSYNAANQLTAWSGTSLLYDANGNMTSDGSNTYTWDSRQRLSTLTGTVSGSFNYDAANRRSQKTIAGQTTSYVFDGANLVQELTGTVTPTVQANLLTGGLDEVFSRTEASGSTYSYLTDALGSTQALTDSSGTSTTQYTYGPYGQTSSSGSASTNSQQYTGRENDGAGLYYYRARYYSPSFGRFISEDPIDLAGGINTYTYVGGNPVSWIDPSGLSSVSYDGQTHTITIRDNAGNTVGTYPANNNTTTTSNGPWPNGAFSFSGSNPHPESDTNGPYGSHGILLFHVPGRTGMGLHSGRANNGAQNHPTLGCIRTTDAAMGFIRNLITTDPVTSMTVINNNINAIQFGTQQ
ncbi:RHS repeat-associated core domain-containing protein [Pseudomonas corrugata]|uniref:RHS repeat-associated core domain-containing protein n=1 Tax=Pseudomonas corrugata TaxID=47879 RepID=UPI003877C568